VPIHVPPLRERLEDVPLLAQQFVQRYSRKHGVRVRGIASDCLAALSSHRWPGNVRELQNVIERAVILCNEGGMLEPTHLGFTASGAKSTKPSVTSIATASTTPAAATSATAESAPAGAGASADGQLPPLAEIEKRHILGVLEATGGNRTHAAKILGISIRTLRNKLNEYNIAGKDETAGE